MIAWIALISWPIIGIILFRKLSLPVALCVTIIGGGLLLPERVGLDLPVLPTFDKHSIPALTALIMTAVIISQSTQSASVVRGWLPRNLITLSLMVLLVFGSFGIILTNRDPLFYGPLYLPGMRIYDGFSFALNIIIALIPMLLARRILATPDAQRTLLLVFAVSALLYTIPTLWEVRMSPQLHRQIYGFFQHGFVQQMRDGGFRAMVFTSHGLTLSIFLTLAILAAAALMRISEQKRRVKWGVAAVFLFIVLILNKSLGALMITVCLLPLVLFLLPKTQLMSAACIAGVVMTYPMLRTADLVPVDRFMSFAESVSAERAHSLQFRLRNEDILLEKARQRPIFGWGGYSRNRIFDESGEDISVTDGEWIIHMGIGGWVRYIGFFGLLCWPVIGLFFSKRERIDPVCAMLSLILCAKLLDLIPNAGMVPYVWLIAGSLLGRLEAGLVDQQNAEITPDPDLQTRTQYSRPLRVGVSGRKPPDGALAISRERPSSTRSQLKTHRRLK